MEPYGVRVADQEFMFSGLGLDKEFDEVMNIMHGRGIRGYSGRSFSRGPNQLTLYISPRAAASLYMDMNLISEGLVVGNMANKSHLLMKIQELSKACNVAHALNKDIEIWW